MLNVGFILQPHFNSQCFRVAKQNQQGKNNNYIIVTCSPKYNGVWSYPIKNISKYDVWQNGNLQCLCIPISDCIKVRELHEIVDPVIKKTIQEQQESWYNNKVKNRDYSYASKPIWMI